MNFGGHKGAALFLIRECVFGEPSMHYISVPLVCQNFYGIKQFSGLQGGSASSLRSFVFCELNMHKLRPFLV